MLLTALPSLLGVPVDIGRDEARELARRELTSQVYRDAEPSLWQRASTWLWDRVTDALASASDAVGGVGWLFLAIVVVTLLLVLIAWRAGAIQGRHRRASTAVFETGALSSGEHRANAAAAAAREDWSTAVVERFRALVRELEERGWLDERPGRTADEAAREAIAHFPEDAPHLVMAATVFDEVVYGERPGTREGHAVVAEVDARVHRREAAR
jgi:predicted DNA-binding protein